MYAFYLFSLLDILKVTKYRNILIYSKHFQDGTPAEMLLLDYIKFNSVQHWTKLHH